MSMDITNSVGEISSGDLENISCVYTALIGKYEPLNEQPMAKQSSVRFICFTDDPELRSDTWEIRPIRPVFAFDPVRSQRDLKLLPHRHLPDFDWSLYIDNSILLKQPPERLIERAMSSPQGMLMAPLSIRQTVLDEFHSVAREGIDDRTRVYEQMYHYSLSHPDVFLEKPWWGAMMVRDHRSIKVRKAMEIWTQHVMRYSRRDQLSVNLALRLVELAVEPLEIDIFGSELHSWPHKHGRDNATSIWHAAPAVTRGSAGLSDSEQDLEVVDSTLRSESDVASLREQAQNFPGFVEAI